MNIQTGLLAYGLNKQQSDIYVALVELLEANVTDLEKKTKIPRATIYKALDVLQREGLVSTFKKNKVQHFTVTNVKRLEHNMHERLQTIQDITPLLKGLVQTAQRGPRIQLLEGKDGVKQAWEELHEVVKTTNHRDMYAIAGTGPHQAHPRYFKDWQTKLEKAGVNKYLCLPERYRHTRRRHKTRFARFFPNTFLFEGALNIIGDTVSLITLEGKNPHATVIHSKELAGMFKKVWDLVWSLSQE